MSPITKPPRQCATPILAGLALAAAAALPCVARPPAEATPPRRSLAVRTVGDSDTALARAVESSWLFRRLLAGSDSWASTVGPEAAGEVTVVAGLLPLPQAGRRLAAEMAVRLPVAFGEGGRLVFDGTAYPSPNLSAALRLPPGSAAKWLVVGRRTEGVVRLVGEVLARETGIRPWHGDDERQADYLLLENPWLQRSGRWRVGQGGRREVEPGHDRDGFAERRQWLASLATLTAPAVRLRVPPGWETRPELRRLAGELARTMEQVAPRVPVDLGRLKRPLTVVVEPDFVVQGRFTGEIGEAVLGEPGDEVGIHLVFDPRDRFAHRFAVARWLLRRQHPDLPLWLERGAALWLLGEGPAAGWYGLPWKQWLPLFAAAGVLPEAGELLSPELAADASEVLWTPAAAAVVGHLDGATVGEKLRRAPDAAAVRAALEAWATAKPEAAAAALQPTAARPRGFLRGVSFAMLNGLSVGYHAPEARRRLLGLGELGADAVSLMPFAYQPDPAAPQLRFLNRSPSSETDVGVVHAARRARELGFTVLWKPQIWVGHGAWPGQIAMTSESDWRLWWRSYHRWMIHQAVLARWAGAQLLSVGVEMGRTLERRAEWEQLIAAVRRVFPGLLTYSANWHDDAEKAGFWGRLDLLGVDAYYPLSVSPQASREELVAGAREVRRRLGRLAEEHGRPVLLTEVGFASRKAAWTAPHEEGGEVSEEDQAKAYEALFAGLGRPPWLAGVFVWKAFSGERADWGRRSGAGADFRFLDRPAEAVVRSYFEPREEPRAATR